MSGVWGGGGATVSQTRVFMWFTRFVGIILFCLGWLSPCAGAYFPMFIHPEFRSGIVLAVGVLVGLLVGVVLILTGAALVDFPRRSHNSLLGMCPSCSYDLTGNTTGTCPECGHVIAAGQGDASV